PRTTQAVKLQDRLLALAPRLTLATEEVEMRRQLWSGMLAIGFAAMSAEAQITIPGADGSDGVFNPTQSVQIDLSQAATAPWDTPSPVQSRGVYDPDKWAIVFKYTSVNIPTGVQVTFRKHPSRAPVIWLVAAGVIINGQVYLGPEDNGINLGNGEPGPGGFRG